MVKLDSEVRRTIGRRNSCKFALSDEAMGGLFEGLRACSPEDLWILEEKLRLPLRRVKALKRPKPGAFS